jgi:hypothetical protein
MDIHELQTGWASEVSITTPIELICYLFRLADDMEGWRSVLAQAHISVSVAQN